MLNIFAQKEIDDLLKKREGETKLGETILVINNDEDFFEEIENTKASFVIVGVPEDIGIKVNGGEGGAHASFFPAIEAFLNTQENQFISGKDILALGYLDYLDTVKDFIPDDAEKGDYLVKQIDKDLSELINLLVSFGKTPIIIGGGQNNAYGNVKGLSMAKKQPINVINLDAHTDLRKLDVRHSGNAFSYAIEDGYLDKYFMFGLHENYTPQYIFDYIHKNINLGYNMFEEIAIYQTTTFNREIQRAKNFINDKPFGIEIDVDSLQSFPSSAMSPTGFSPQHARRFVHYFGKNKNASYLHIAEANPTIGNKEGNTNQVGKFISYIMSDFIKAKKDNL